MTDLKFVVDYTDLQLLDRELLNIEKTAKSSASVFEREYNKVERQLKKSATANQQFYNTTLGLDREFKKAASSAAVFEKQLLQNDKAWAKEERRVEELKRKYNPLYRAVKQYERALDELNEAHRMGALSTDRHKLAVDGLDKEYRAFQNGTAGWSNQFVQEANRSGKSLNKFGAYSQQFGYQMSDFVVQVQGGTSAFVAFGQQGAQLFGLISGPWGAALSIGAALVGAFGAAWMRSKEQMEEAETGAKALEDRIKSINAEVEEYFRNQGYLERGLTPEEGDLSAGIKEAQKELDTARETLQRFENSIVGATGSAQILMEEFRGIWGGDTATKFEEAQKAVEEAEANLQRLQDKLTEEQALENWEGAFSEAVDNMGQKFDYLAGRASDYADVLLMQAGRAFDRLVFEQEQNREIEKRVELAEAQLYFGKESEEYERLIKEHAVDTYETMLEQNGVMDDMRANLVAAYEAMLGLEASAKRTSELDLNNLTFGFSSSGADTTIGDGTVLDLGDGRTEIVDFPSRSKKKKGGSSGRNKETVDEFLAGIEREIDLKKDLLGIYGSEAEIVQRISELKEKAIDKEFDLSNAQLEKIAKEEQALEEALALQESYFNDFSSSISSGLMDMVTGAQSVEDAFKDMIFNILETIYQQSVLDPLAENAGSFLTDLVGGLFGSANGNVFSGGRMMAFANGGVVQNATTFPMAGGRGIMGEAGPEAIMPLTRGANGKLGVEASGGDSGGGDTYVVEQHFSFSANGDDSVKKIIAEAAPQIAKMTEKSIMSSRRRGGQMKATFG